MADILQFVRPGQALDPVALTILAAAYDRAIETLQNGHTPNIVREIIAGRIIDAGIRGVRDPDALHKLALSGM